MIDPALLAEVDALSEGELIELAGYVGQRVARGANDQVRASREQQALLQARRGDPDPAHWSSPEETSAFLRSLRA